MTSGQYFSLWLVFLKKPCTLLLCRNFFENQVKPAEPKPVVKRTKSGGWKPKPVLQESPKKPSPPPPVLKEKPVLEKPKPKEPQNQADLVRLALAQQPRPRSVSELAQEMVRGKMVC